MLFHSLQNALRRNDVLKLYAVDFDTPLIGSVVKHTAQLGVDRVARGQRLIQFHLTNDVSQGSLRELLNGIGQIVDLINSLERIHNLEIEQGIDLHLDIILGDDILLVEVVDLLSQVYAVAIDIASAHQCANDFCTVDKRNNDVDTGFQRCIILTQSLNDLGLTLWNDDDGHLGKDQREDDKSYQYVSSNHMVIVVLWVKHAINSLLRRNEGTPPPSSLSIYATLHLLYMVSFNMTYHTLRTRQHSSMRYFTPHG